MVIAKFDNNDDGSPRLKSEDVLRYFDERKHLVRELSVEGQLWKDDDLGQFADIVRNDDSKRICLQRLSLSNNCLTSHCGDSLARILDIVGSLRELDLSGNKVEADGLKKLARALATERCTLRTLNLFNNHLGKACAKQISLILLRNRSITSLNLGKNSLNNKNCVKKLAEALCANEFLEQLDLSQNNMRIHATELACILNPHLSSCPLRELNLTNNNLTDSAVEHITGTMLEFGNTRLEKLIFSHNKLTLDGVKYCALLLERSHTIRELVLSSCHVDDEGATLLCQGLGCTEYSISYLCHLDLSFNRIHDSGAVELAAFLEGDFILEKLNLASNAIGDAGASSFCHALVVNSTLKELDLTGNQIGNQGAVRLAEIVCTDHFTLDHLKWEENKRMADIGIARLSGAFRFRQSLQTWLGEKLRLIETRRRMPQLNLKVGDEEMICICRHLDEYRPTLPLVTFKSLDGLQAVTSRGVQTLANTVISQNSINLNRLCLQNTVMGDRGAAFIAQSLVYNQNLTVLSLTSCKITNEGASFLSNMLRRNRTIQRLDLKMNRIGDRGAQDLFAAISDPAHPTTYSLNLSHNQLSDHCFAGIISFEPLQEVQLGYNMITDRGALDIAKICMNSNNLKRLHVPGNHMTNKGVQALNLFIPENIGFFESGNQRPRNTTIIEGD